MIKKIDVTGPESLNYVKEQLGRGISLSDSIGNTNLENGFVYSFVPENTSEINLWKFKSGGIYPFDKEQILKGGLIPVQNDAIEVVIEDIISFTKNDVENCCLFENPHAAPEFHWVVNSKIEYVHIKKDQMFFFFNHLDNDVKKVKEAFLSSAGYVFLCVLSRMPLIEQMKFKPFSEINLKLLDDFVSKMEMFFVRAYDGEGFLMWSRQKIKN